jgi:hypothetical protein
MKLYQVILSKFDGSDDNLYTEAYPPTDNEKVERIRFDEIIEAEMEEARGEADHPDSLEPYEGHNYFGLTYYRNGASQVIQVMFKEFNER